MTVTNVFLDISHDINAVLYHNDKTIVLTVTDKTTMYH